MRRPVIFQDLETELSPVVKYLQGHVLNAGCGDRDISQYLVANGAESVDNCDIKSSLPGVMICALENIPKPEGTYHSILCNAVLEHVKDPDNVIKELKRLLKPGGHLVICVPFLQPYHGSPDDYRRFTRQGLEELFERHGFKLIEILPVHSLAQTVSWTLWSGLEEKGARWARAMLWVPLYLWNYFSKGTDFCLDKAANTFQAVLKLPDES